MSQNRTIVLGAVLAGMLCGVLFFGHSGPATGCVPFAQAQDAGKQPNDELAELKAEIARLKTVATTAAAVSEVDYHSQNLWFAGSNGNWPLAEYYWEKVILHLRMTKGAELVDKISAAQKSQQEEALKQIEKTPYMQVGNAIKRKDVVAFATNYRALLVGCYDCHKAVGKPFLRPRMPVKPAQAIINVDPNANWPK